MVEGTEFILTETATLFVAQRGCNIIHFEPNSNAWKVVLVDEHQVVGLKKTTKVNGMDCIKLIVRNGVHQDRQCPVVMVDFEGKFHICVFELERFYG